MYPVVPSALLAIVHCSELSVWLKGSGTRLIISAGPSPKHLLNTLLLPSSHGDPAATIPQEHSLHRPLQVIVGADGSVSQLKALDMGLGDD